MHEGGVPPLVRMVRARKRRAQGGSVFDLRIPDLQIPAGALVAVVGDSGCGKSTLLDMLALVMQPTAADLFELRFDQGSDPVDAWALWTADAEADLAALRRDHLGYILQTGGLLPFLNVADNILLPARVKGLPDVSAVMESIAGRIGLAGCLDRMPDSLSIGQRQRVAILRALLHEPRLVLADEPTAAVDKARATGIMADLHALSRERGVSVVVVTHDLGLVREIADHTYSFRMEQVSDRETRSICFAVH